MHLFIQERVEYRGWQTQAHKPSLASANSFIGTLSCLWQSSMAAFVLHCHHWAVETKTLQSAKPTVLTLWPLIEKVYWHLVHNVRKKVGLGLILEEIPHLICWWRSVSLKGPCVGVAERGERDNPREKSSCIRKVPSAVWKVLEVKGRWGQWGGLSLGSLMGLEGWEDVLGVGIEEKQRGEN